MSAARPLRISGGPVLYPARKPRNGHLADCPYYATYKAPTCPCCQGERKAGRSRRLALVPDPAEASKPQEETSCAKCCRPHQAPPGSTCTTCQPVT